MKLIFTDTDGTKFYVIPGFLGVYVKIDGKFYLISLEAQRAVEEIIRLKKANS